MSSSSSFYDKKRIGKARSLAASPSNDAAGELLRYLEQAHESTPDVAALVRDVEESDAALASARLAGDTDAVVTPALAVIPFSSLTDDRASSRALAALHATHSADEAGATGRSHDGDEVNHAAASLAAARPAGPSLTIPFLLVGAVIIAGLGIPSLRRAPAAVTSHATSGSVSAPAAHDAVLPAAVPGEQDERAIRSIVSAYASAYTRLNVADVQAVFPTVDAAALNASFAGLRQQQVDILGLQVHVSGPRATVEGAWRTTGAAANGSPFVLQSPVVLTLDQRDGRWFIVNRY